MRENEKCKVKLMTFFFNFFYFALCTFRTSETFSGSTQMEILTGKRLKSRRGNLLGHLGHTKFCNSFLHLASHLVSKNISCWWLMLVVTFLLSAGPETFPDWTQVSVKSRRGALFNINLDFKYKVQLLGLCYAYKCTQGFD